MSTQSGVLVNTSYDSFRMRILWFTIFTFFAVSSASGQRTFVKKTYFDTEKTKIKEVITLKKADSTLHGVYHSFFENGSLAISGYYENNQTDSTWIYYFENGREKAKGSYQQGLQERKWRYYFENGNTRVEGAFKNNKKHGQWTFYYENGSEKSSGIYFNDQKEGIWNYFYEEGSLKAQAYYERGNGPYKEFYPSGKLKAEGINKDDQSEGEWTYYYESGEIEARGSFKKGIRDGFWQYFHKNGQVAAEGNFSNGEKSGVWKYYFPDGSISSEGQMVNNQQDGFWKLYYQSGEVKGEGKYDRGTGEYVEYYANGKQKARGKIKDGKKDEKWTYYTEEGLEDGIAFFENGVGEYYGYYPDGTTKMTGQIEDGKRVGKWTLYNPDGTVAGIYKPVYEEEKPIFRTTELDDNDNKKGSDKPEYRYKNKKLRYFNPRINEYTGYIVGTNPLWAFVGKFPVSVEYYIQERLGFETEVTIHNRPFFQYPAEVKTNSLYKTGIELAIKQKFYNPDAELGMFYFGHELLGAYIEHGSNILDSTNTSIPPIPEAVKMMESRIAYGLFIGNRWMERAGDSGLTFDFNIGLAIGRRFMKKDYSPDPVYDQLFNELNQNKLYLPIIITLNIGYAGPKRRSTSF